MRVGTASMQSLSQALALNQPLEKRTGTGSHPHA